MTKHILSLSFTLTLMGCWVESDMSAHVNSAAEESYTIQPGVLDRDFTGAFEACFDAQLAISNPKLDIQKRMPKEGELLDYTVTFAFVPQVSVYHISAAPKKPDPYAFSFLCRLSKQTDLVLQARYYEGHPSTGTSKTVNLVDHDPLEGIEKRELSALREQGTQVNIPLNEFFD